MHGQKKHQIIQKGVLHNILVFYKIPKYLSAVDYALALPCTFLSNYGPIRPKILV